MSGGHTSGHFGFVIEKEDNFFLFFSTFEKVESKIEKEK
jgi:hypothetical protein